MSENGLLIATSHTTQHAANKKWASHLHHTPHCIALPSKHRHHTRTTTTLEQLLSRRRPLPLPLHLHPPPPSTASHRAAARHPFYSLHRPQHHRAAPLSHIVFLLRHRRYTNHLLFYKAANFHTSTLQLRQQRSNAAAGQNCSARLVIFPCARRLDHI